ncbi:glycosyltransferase family 1 protein [Anaerobutyricum soehngenii]|uniref:Glycosyltransferase family 1 protein n=1 Tax=Anaerobutyricum soehngenii TaxID=105843 RepID=A0A6N7YG99_9FIRM|nr:glycosyltransferase [Anaerobutyricum soehngenii]MSU82544.1 glycosyltransferase family 1 protein [Anaerobutyricum soehngenii]
MEKTKILYLIYSLNAGGIESLCMNILDNIDLTRFQIDFAVVKEKNTEQFYDVKVKSYGMKIFAVGDLRHGTAHKYLSTRKDIYNLIKKEKYDVVHIHCGHWDKFPDAISAKLCGVNKIIIHSHNGQLTRDTKLYRIRCMLQKVIKQFYPFIATDFFSCSDLASQWAFPSRVIKAGKVVYIKNGIDLNRFKYSDELRTKYRHKFDFKDEFVVGHIGRMSEQKNHEFLIDIFNEIVKKKSNSKLLLVGEGELENQIKSKVSRLNLLDKVVFLGTTSEIPGVLAAIDVFVFPSRFEGLPVVGIEAQAMGVPVFASDKISNDVKITEAWHTISLEKSKEDWAKIILKTNLLRANEKCRKNVEDAGFDIRDTTKKISNIYLEGRENEH